MQTTKRKIVIAAALFNFIQIFTGASGWALAPLSADFSSPNFSQIYEKASTDVKLDDIQLMSYPARDENNETESLLTEFKVNSESGNGVVAVPFDMYGDFFEDHCTTYLNSGEVNDKSLLYRMPGTNFISSGSMILKDAKDIQIYSSIMHSDFIPSEGLRITVDANDLGVYSDITAPLSITYRKYKGNLVGRFENTAGETLGYKVCYQAPYDYNYGQLKTTHPQFCYAGGDVEFLLDESPGSKNSYRNPSTFVTYGSSLQDAKQALISAVRQEEDCLTTSEGDTVLPSKYEVSQAGAVHFNSLDEDAAGKEICHNDAKCLQSRKARCSFFRDFIRSTKITCASRVRDLPIRFFYRYLNDDDQIKHCHSLTGACSAPPLFWQR